MSFSDLLQTANTLLKASKPKFKWIIIDETQDSDKLQLDFIHNLKSTNTKLFAVGDPNQVIYSWRGGSVYALYTLKHKYNAKELSLPINYRSSSFILEAARCFLQDGSNLTGIREQGNKIVVKNHYNPFNEACYLADKIQELHSSGVPYKEMAIFYRLQNQSQVFEDVFTKNEIPYEVPMLKLNKEMNSDIDSIKLMTLHASKGLEFSYVFITGVNYGLIPLHARDMEEEEERRLFFVGITRAKDYLELSYYTNPDNQRVKSGESKYIQMLPQRLIKKEDEKSATVNLQQLKKQIKLQLQEAKEIPQKQVMHRKYGIGKVLKEDEMIIEVEFENYGVKEFMTTFSELEFL
jgi:superfamily I DNA/RNA helicase